jgi:hypothetical protein
MDNLEYLDSIGVTSPERRDLCLTTMAKYGDNHWWEPGVCLYVFAYYQLHEDIMLCSRFDRFHEAVEAFLDRPVIINEFAWPKGLRREAEIAWKAMTQ